MDKKDILKNSYVSNSNLYISVRNINEFNELLKQVEDKQKELNSIVEKLSRFQLEINFLIQNDEQ